MSLLRKMISTNAMNGLWQRARLGSYPRKHPCPGCNRKMEEITVEAEGLTRAIDVCGSCQFVWLDEGEWADLAFFAVDNVTPQAMREAVRERIAQKRKERNAPQAREFVPPLPKRVEPAKTSIRQPPKLERSKVAEQKSRHQSSTISQGESERLPPPIHRSTPVKASATRDRLVEAKRRRIEATRQQRRREAGRSKARREVSRPRHELSKRKTGWGEGPTNMWQWIPAMLGMPVEDQQPSGPRQDNEKPWFTWFLATSIVIISLLAMMDLTAVVDAYGLIPAEFGRLGGLTWLTSFFLHAGFLHLLGNVYFLVVFGDNVEKCLGTLEFFLLLCLSTVSGHFAHILLDPSSTLPCVGASGGISGVMAFYALRFRHQQLAVMFWFFFKTYWLRMSAFIMFVIWVVLQLFIAGQQAAGITDISGAAHLGGALGGVFVWLIWRLNHGKRYVSEGGFSVS